MQNRAIKAAIISYLVGLITTIILTPHDDWAGIFTNMSNLKNYLLWFMSADLTSIIWGAVIACLFIWLWDNLIIRNKVNKEIALKNTEITSLTSQIRVLESKNNPNEVTVLGFEKPKLIPRGKTKFTFEIKHGLIVDISDEDLKDDVKMHNVASILISRLPLFKGTVGFGFVDSAKMDGEKIKAKTEFIRLDSKNPPSVLNMFTIVMAQPYMVRGTPKLEYKGDKKLQPKKEHNIDVGQNGITVTVIMLPSPDGEYELKL